MASIEIKDTKKVVSDAEELSASTVEFDSARESIEYILNEVKQYWEQTQQDAQKFSTGLTKNVETLTKIVECNKEFATAITNYAQAQEKTSQQTASV